MKKKRKGDKDILLFIYIPTMCGIWALLSQLQITGFGKNYDAFMRMKHRGPEYSSFDLINPKFLLGFHRLSIMDLSADGNQPFHYVRDDGSCIYCVCNGEIYDQQILRKEYNITTKSHSDCEIIIPLYEKLGIEKMIRLLGSEFFFILLDISKEGHMKIIVGSDPLGNRPGYYSPTDNSLYVCSELEGLSDLTDKVYRFPPGYYMIYENDNKTPFHEGQLKFTQYYTYQYKELSPIPSLDKIYYEIRKRLTNSVRRRLMTDREIGFLLSGGLDSSLVCGITIDLIEKEFPELMKMPIKFFTIQLEGGSIDVPYAIEVYDFLKKKHHLLEHYIVTISKQDLLATLMKTPRIISSWDTTTNRASALQLAICQFIKEKTNVRVLMVGENADECCCGYRFFHNAPTPDDAKMEAIRLVKNVHTSDGLRTDRTASYHSIEVRPPFTDTEFVDYYLSLPSNLMVPINGLEKYTLRYAFKGHNIIPDSVLMRPKCAFSDSTSKKEHSWYQIIQEHMETLITDEEFLTQKDKYKHCPPYTKENYYYRREFARHYGDSEEKAKTIPYFWMPKWSPETTDPSARTLNNYKE